MGATLIGDPFFWGLAFIGLIIVGVSKGGFAGGLGVVGLPFSRGGDPGQSSGSDYVALLDYNGSCRYLRLAWTIVLGATQVIVTGGGCWCLLRRTQLSSAIRQRASHNDRTDWSWVWNEMVGSAPGIHAISRAGSA